MLHSTAPDCLLIVERRGKRREERRDNVHWMNRGLLLFVFGLCLAVFWFFILQPCSIYGRWSTMTRDKDRRLPKALIIGVRKGGTRALLDALALHRSIRIARHEVHFFDQNMDRGIDWYRAQMPISRSDQVTIEKTPAYFTSHSAPGRVFEMDEKMKMILILRDPVTRTLSDFTQVYHTKLDRNKTPPSFEQLAFTVDGKLNRGYRPIRNSLYSEHIANWLVYFPLSQFLFIDGDKFITDPLPQIRLAEQFLRLPPAISANQLVFNSTKGFYCFLRSGRRQPRCLDDTKGREHVHIAEEMMLKLKILLRPESERFCQLINNQSLLSSWL